MKGLIAIAFAVVLIYGYVANIVKFVSCDFEPNYKCEVIHGIGILTGLGAVTGYIDTKEK